MTTKDKPKIVLTNEDLAETHLKVAEDYVLKATATSDINNKVKYIFIAKHSLTNALNILGYPENIDT